MHLQTFNTSWDYHLSPHHGLDDISLDKVQKIIDKINSEAGQKIADDPLTFLLKQEIVRDGAITHAGFLLFTKKDTLFTTVELGRFQTDIIIKDTARSKSDILTQVEVIMEFVKKHINKEIIITGDIRNTQRWQYPLDAIREIILNMVIHRDYRSSSDSIVKVFDHKIEFYNPGQLPSNITIDDLLANTYRSTPRNKLIADFCKQTGIIEKYGSGIQRIIRQFREYNLPDPHFEHISDGFMVTVTDGMHDTVTGNVTGNVTENVTENRKTLIFKLIQRNPEITTTEIADTLNVSRRTIARDINAMKENGQILRIGSAKKGKWKIVN